MTVTSDAHAGVVKVRRAPRTRTSGRVLRRFPLHAVVLLLSAVWFTPIVALVVSSLRPEGDALTTGWWRAFVAPQFTGANYSQAISEIGLGTSVVNSLVIAIPVTCVTVLLSAFAAFALAQMRFRGQTVIFMLLVGLLVIPPQVTLVPVLRFYNAVGLSGTVPAVWIYQVGFSVPFGVFLLRGFFASIPRELLDAAAMDGASMFRTFVSIVLPTAMPVLASLAILVFLWSWNDLLIPLLFIGGASAGTPLTVQVAGLAQANGGGQGATMAAALVSVVLPLVIVITLQRYLVRGILGGAVKG